MNASESGLRSDARVVQVTHRGRLPPWTMNARITRLSRPPESGRSQRSVSMASASQLQATASRSSSRCCSRPRATGSKARGVPVETGPPRATVEGQPGVGRQAPHATSPRSSRARASPTRAATRRRPLEVEVAEQGHRGALRGGDDEALSVAGVPERARGGHVVQQLDALVGEPGEHVGAVGRRRTDVCPVPGLADDAAQQHAARRRADTLVGGIDDDSAEPPRPSITARVRRDVARHEPGGDLQELRGGVRAARPPARTHSRMRSAIRPPFGSRARRASCPPRSGSRPAVGRGGAPRRASSRRIVAMREAA